MLAEEPRVLGCSASDVIGRPLTKSTSLEASTPSNDGSIAAENKQRRARVILGRNGLSTKRGTCVYYQFKWKLQAGARWLEKTGYLMHP